MRDENNGGGGAGNQPYGEITLNGEPGDKPRKLGFLDGLRESDRDRLMPLSIRSLAQMSPAQTSPEQTIRLIAIRATRREAEIMDLNTLWFLLLGVMFTAYAVLDGFDLGVGALHLFTKTDSERRAMITSIGPVWDGNEVWLVTGVGALGAFPDAYSTLFRASTRSTC